MHSFCFLTVDIRQFVLLVPRTHDEVYLNIYRSLVIVTVGSLSYVAELLCCIEQNS